MQMTPRVGKRESAGKGKEERDPARRPLSNYNYDEAVQRVQEWNEALKCA